MNLIDSLEADLGKNSLPTVHVGDSVEVRVPGGALRIEWDGEGEVRLEGPAARAFAARWEGAPA